MKGNKKDGHFSTSIRKTKYQSPPLLEPQTDKFTQREHTGEVGPNLVLKCQASYILPVSPMSKGLHEQIIKENS